MRLLLLVAATLFAAVSLHAEDAPVNQLTPQEAADGWKLLFDGKDAGANFRGYNKPELPPAWVVEDGTLFRKEKGGDIVTKEKYESFELSIDWKISPGGNSGIMFKVQEDAKNPPWFTGPEAQIQDNIGGHDPQKAGWLYQLYPAAEDKTNPVGEWNHFVLKCQKSGEGKYKCEHWMNGTKYVEYEIGSDDWNEKWGKSKFKDKPEFAKAAAGHICLQDHGNLVWFRNIKIKVLK